MLRMGCGVKEVLILFSRITSVIDERVGGRGGQGESQIARLTDGV